MSIPGSVHPLFLGAAGQATGGGAYQISRSLRFNSGDSAYLNRTPAFAASSSNKLTYSTWVKRTKLGSSLTEHFGLSTAVSPSSRDAIRFSNDSIDVYVNEAVSGNVTTSAVFRDTSAWYHIVVSIDTTKATAADRIIIYVNGVLQTVTGTQPSQNYNFTGFLVSGKEQNIGRSPQPAYYADSYLAEIYCIDGQALDPSSFAKTDAITGQWVPKAYSGSYGTNGFRLAFDSYATTAALGTDTSGNGNTWTVNNFSVTAGSGNDSLVDTPTSYGTDTGVGGSVRGNYCTLNPLDNSSGMTLANGNLDGSETGGGHKGTRATIKFPSSGKWYYEGTVTTLGGACCIGAATNAAANPDINASGSYYILVNSSGNVQRYQSFASYTGFDTPAVGTILRVAYDADAQKLWLGLNGLWMNGSNGTTGDPATGANATFSSITDIYPAIDQQTSAVAVNFGQRAFAYTAPSGFKALCDTNLPTPLVAKGSSAMDVLTWSGSGGARSLTGLNFSPDFVWGKQRNGANAHQLYDIVRGAGNNKDLASDYTAAEGSATTSASVYGYLNSFDSAGFSVANGTDGTYGAGYWNMGGRTYAAFCWDAGTTTVSNSVGSITSQVRANVSAGFSVVTYTGNAVSGATVGHGLGVAPQLIIIKSRVDAYDWIVYHASIGNTGAVRLNTTAATQTVSTWFNNSGPSSTTFTLGNTGGTNESGSAFVSYCFAPVVGYSNGFSYTGNGAADGSFVYLGFRPRLIMLKRSDSTSNWTLLDTSREGYNVDNDPLYPNLSDAEGTTDLLDITSNGFKLRSTDASVNASAGTYIGFAWAENPFQYARAR